MAALRGGPWDIPESHEASGESLDVLGTFLGLCDVPVEGYYEGASWVIPLWRQGGRLEFHAGKVLGGPPLIPGRFMGSCLEVLWRFFGVSKAGFLQY